METLPAIQCYLQAVPKAELHVHLEGSIRPHTFLELARRNNVALPVSNLEELRQWFTYRDFEHFVQLYSRISSCLKTSEDYELIVYEFGEEMKRQNVRYAEVTVSVSTHRFLWGLDHDTYFSGLSRGRARAYQDFGVEIYWVFDIVRDIQEKLQRDARADFTTRVALECMRDGVVALGLGGNEAPYPPEYFAPFFEKALSEGLHSTPHAGEGSGPASVWGALEVLGAERIGHGVRAIEDPVLVKHLAQQRIPLEICPGSNICLGIYPDFAAHPLPRLHAAGVQFSVNSDDPPLFNTTLNQDVERLHSVFGLDLDAIDEIILNGVRHSFQSQERKLALEAEFRAEMKHLRQECGLV
ncbi:MAG TPA: adenosine deaminase [Ktedonobacteraceae bacterium]|nr:adenosine deaminase [Ktedonobacteraceae bacterium]